VKYVNYTHIQ